MPLGCSVMDHVGLDVPRSLSRLHTIALPARLLRPPSCHGDNRAGIACGSCSGREGLCHLRRSGALRGIPTLASSSVVPPALPTPQRFRPYAGSMRTATRQSESLRAAIASHRRALEEILGRYGATNARLFGSVARGDATPESDIDLLVDLTPGGGNELLRVSGIAEELTELLGTRVDVVATSLLRGEVSSSAHADAVAV